ncbi:Pyridine nucleotide-disulphide oxidoreductase [Hathewaya proteolytica DSM 3090]|uniref:Pyridine nucleotide-disulphide oxidoreductase n=1 Tax=Hathewaya proteolytica DSM 3090 TaxID=1121331 RepID=A0A1M6RNC0_9CLOT|nr:NAD(P)/FAD-dependent oxidoreductase [Hathewaya proteolytica]SHK33952.1 Pyridine nucleotide-disulphide oxidoreductase [Hathewaya proteolytica DSM 3090]
MNNYDLVIIGAGASGLSAAIQAKKKGIDNILILEKEESLGGVLNHCIHSGFGKYILKEEMTGPEYANILVTEVENLNIEYKLSTVVLRISEEKQVTYVNSKEGVVTINSKAIIVATGAIEKTRGVENISGNSFAGVFTAGMVQKLVNVEGILPGKSVVILGSGDMALVVAKTLILEGAKVEAFIEKLPYCRGLEENYIDCIKYFDIPLKLQHTITNISGKERVNGVTIAQVNDEGKIIKNTEQFMKCDTVIVAVGIVQDYELLKDLNAEFDPNLGSVVVDECMQTSLEGIFICGNAVNINDFVDDVTVEGAMVGCKAAAYINGDFHKGEHKKVIVDAGIEFVIPQKINTKNLLNGVQFKFRTTKIYRNVIIKICSGETELAFYRENILPSRMEILYLPKEILEETGDEINISINEL